MTQLESIKYKHYERLRKMLLETLNTKQLIMLNDMENARVDLLLEIKETGK